MSHLLLIALTGALLTACASTAPEQQTAEVATPAAIEPEPAPQPPERAFPDDSVYPLLVAEFALRRRQYA